MNALSLYRAGNSFVPPTSTFPSDVPAACPLSSPVSSGWLNSHSTALSASPFYEYKHQLVQVIRLAYNTNSFAKCLARLSRSEPHIRQHPNLLCRWLRTTTHRSKLDGRIDICTRNHHV